jgi:hypothetical protein
MQCSLPRLVSTALLTCAPALAQDAPVAPLLTHNKLRQAITRLASEHAGIVTRLEIGTARDPAQLRRIDCLRLGAGDAREGRPAILIVANIDGPTVYTSGVALELARRLAEGYAADQAVRALLDTTTVYIIPRANPDAAEARFAQPLAEVRASGASVDQDRDGPVAQQGRPPGGDNEAGDVNGDGFVTWMRVPDPRGTWLPDDLDPRALREADRARGERGRWRLVPEGLDRDGDGEIGEDPLKDGEVNRNFPAGWEEHAGLFPTDEPEARALCDFVLAHEDLQLVLVYGEHDNLHGDLEAVADDAADADRVPAAGLRRSDADLVQELGRRYRAASANTAGSAEDDLAGTFQAFCYDHRGLLTLCSNPWQVPLDAELPARDEDAPPVCDDARRLVWAAQHEVDLHLGWTPFNHPELGAVDVGGFRPYALLEPTDEERARIVDGEFAFVLGLGEVLARVRLADVVATDLGSGLLEVSATLTNDALLPLLTTWGKRTRTTRPARVRLVLPDAAELLAGEQQTLVSDLDGLGGEHELRWLVRGALASAIGVAVDTDHAGRAQAVPEVK